MRKRLMAQVEDFRASRRRILDVYRLQMLYDRWYRTGVVLLTRLTIEIREFFGVVDRNWWRDGKKMKRARRKIEEKSFCLHNGKVQQIDNFFDIHFSPSASLTRMNGSRAAGISSTLTK